MLNNRWLAGAACAGMLVLSGAAHAAGVSFVEPKDGATVSNPIHVKFAVEGMKIVPAGTMTEGTGHHHLIIDGQPLPIRPPALHRRPSLSPREAIGMGAR